MTRYGFFDVNSDDDDGVEPPHPIGFETPPARSGRGSIGSSYSYEYSPSPPQRTNITSSAGRAGRSKYAFHFDDDFDDDLDFFGVTLRKQQEYPPIRSYIHASTASTTALLRYREPRQDFDDDDDDATVTSTSVSVGSNNYYNDDGDDDDGDDVQRLWKRMSKLSTTKNYDDDIFEVPFSRPTTTSRTSSMSSSSRQVQIQIQQKIQLIKQQMEQENSMAIEQVKYDVLDLHSQAEIIEQNRRAEEDKQRQREEDERLAQEARDQEELKAKMALLEQEKLQAEEVKKAEETKKAEEEADAARKTERDAKAAAATEYVTMAKKLVSQLVALRASIEPFDNNKDKLVSKRRLGFKKIVRGKVNTLNETTSKIQEVATDVAEAIAVARHDDEQIKQALGRKEPGLTPDMARGKRYLVDLLASGIIQRVQADGFNGPRGDGFPLAAMCAMISLEHKEFVPILSAHVYTVCPTAIPTLPKTAPDCSEEELMSSLGMIKEKNGEYETFDKFLARTENLISIVANIMSSSPSTHALFDGHRGAAEWLKRFLRLLPPPPSSPLPLLTAPVLHAFLMGAGHMLANIYPDHFKKCLSVITKDVMSRLDEGTIGKPSAVRLEKLISVGFEGFRTTLPPKALPELYYGANGTVQKQTGTSFEGTIGQPDSATHNNNNSNNNPNSFSASSPFGRPPTAQSSSVSASNPFGGSSNNPNSGSGGGTFGGGGGSNPFGGSGTTFGKIAGGSASAKTGSPFSSGQNQSTAFGTVTGGTGAPSSGFSQGQTGPFSGGASGSNPSPFGGSSSNPSPFGGGSSTTSNVSPFGGGGASNPSPFVGGATSNPSPFGGGAASNPSPFGGGGASNPSPFGSGAASNPSPFGGGASSNPSPFGGGAASNPSPFGGGAASNPSPFGVGTTSNPSPFGGGAASNPSPFGGSSSSNPSPFGGGAKPSPSPFGGGTASNPSPFGRGTASNPSPFGGGNTNAAPFGGNPSPFGGGNNQGGGGSMSGKPPCKFFAQGRCRFGNNCKFSHETGGGSGGGFGSNPSPFGNPRR